MTKRKYNEYFHVYIICSKSDPAFVKVGKTNNLKRVAYFSEAGYAGITDWIQVFTLPVDSNEAALALEAMICAKLNGQGFKRPKIFWDDLKVEGRRVGATECYNCHVEEVIKVGIQMSNVYCKFIG